MIMALLHLNLTQYWTAVPYKWKFIEILNYCIGYRRRLMIRLHYKTNRRHYDYTSWHLI